MTNRTRAAPAVVLLLLATAAAGVGQEAPGLPGQLRTDAGNTVHFVSDDSILAARVVRALEEMPPLPGLPELAPREVEVILAPDRDRFAQATGGRPPEWSAGVAVPARGRIVLPTWEGAQIVRPGAGQLLRHEWAHLAVYRASGGLRAPRWFSEGYAEWAGGWDRSRAWRLRLLLALGRTPPLDSLSLSWPAGRATAESAYLLSASVVQYLVEASGERGLAALFRRWRETARFETALREVYGVTSAQLEEDWRGWARDRYGWLYVLSHSSLAWGLLALLLVGTAWFRRRYNRDRMARLRARELPEDPAFWEPPPAGGPGSDPEGGPGGIRKAGPDASGPSQPPE